MSEPVIGHIAPDSATPWEGLDQVDLAIVDALQDDGRASLAKLSRDVGLPVAKVKLRYDRLLGRGVLHTVALIDPAVLGRSTVGHVEIVTRRPDPGLAERLALLPGVAWIGLGADYDRLLVQVSTSSNGELARLVNTSFRAEPDVESLTTSIVLRGWAPRFSFTPGPRQELDDIIWRTGYDVERELDELDRQLLACMEPDARVSLTAMSAATGLSVPATRQRARRLIESGTVRIRTEPDPRAAGVSSVRLLMEVQGDLAATVAEIAAMPNVNYISESTGVAPLSVELLCANEAQISEGFARVSSAIGVRSARMVRFRSAIFRNGNW